MTAARAASLFWFVAFAIALLDGADWWTLHTRLTVVGWTTEAVGLTLLASDLLAEPAAAMWRTARTRTRRVLASLLRRRLATIVPVTIAGEANVAAELTVTTTPALTLEELTQQLHALRLEVRRVDRRHDEIAEDIRRDITRSHDELLQGIASSVDELRVAYRPLRLGGFAVALFGSSLLALANLL